MKENNNFSDNEVKDYEFFNDKVWREELLQQTETVVNYLRKEKISSIILVDRSARPFYVALKEYFRLKHPNEKVPNIYFINPLGFKAKENFTNSELEDLIMDCSYKGEMIKELGYIRSDKDIIADFKKTFKELLKNKQDKILLFDTCVHTGASLKPIKKVFEELDFESVQIGAVTKDHNISDFNIDFSVGEFDGCYHFYRDKMVGKIFGSVCSKLRKLKLTSEPRDKSIQLRKDIKKIIRDFLKN